MSRFLLSPRWMLGHVLAATAVTTCVALGFWQLRRLDERQARNALLEARSTMSEEALGRLAPSAARPGRLAYRRVLASGSYDPQMEVVLRARTLEGRAGNHVLTPLVTAEGYAVIVDRGWVPLEMDDPPVAPAAPPPGQVRVTGLLLPAEPKSRFGPQDPPPGIVEGVARIDPGRLRQQLPYPVLPLYLLLVSQEPPQAGGLPELVPPPVPDEGPHLSYAVQWFAFAAVALVVYGALVRKEARLRAGAGLGSDRGVNPAGPGG